MGKTHSVAARTASSSTVDRSANPDRATGVARAFEHSEIQPTDASSGSVSSLSAILEHFLGSQLIHFESLGHPIDEIKSCLMQSAMIYRLLLEFGGVKISNLS